MPESRSPEDTLGGGSSTCGISANVMRLNCIEVARDWCDVIYAEEAEDERAHANVLKNNVSVAFGKRRREQEGHALSGDGEEHRQSRRLGRRQRVQHALFIVRCCASGSSSPCTGVSRGNSGFTGTKARRVRDPLTLLLHDISSLSVFCLVRQSGRRTCIRFSVLLLPDDLAYGGALLEESLRGPMSRHYCVKLFQGSAGRLPRRRQDGNGVDEEKDESVTFLERLKLWLGASTKSGDPHSPGGGDSVMLHHEKHEEEVVTKAQKLEPGFFFARYENLPFCCFLWEALRRFPVILTPSLLRQLQSLWAFRHQLPDVVVGLHSVLSPFTLSCSAHVGMNDVKCEPSLDTFCEVPSNRRDVAEQLHNSAELLNILFDAACAWADGHPFNEAIAFAVQYEDVVYGRVARLQRIPGLTTYVEHLTQKPLGPGGFLEALTSCVPVFTPSALLTSGVELDDCPMEKVSRHERTPPPLPSVIAIPGSKVSLTPELLRATLLAVLPPDESLNEVQEAMNAAPLTSGGHSEGSVGEPMGRSVAYNNFFSPLVPDSVRVLYILTSHAMSSTNVNQQFVPLSLIQRICQLSDESLIRSLVELQLTGMVTVNVREFKARSSLLSLR